MKLKDLLTSVVENKKNGQLNTSIKRRELKKIGLSENELLNLRVEPNLKKLLFE